MTKPTTTYTFATVALLGAILPALLSACSTEQVPIGQQNNDGHAADGSGGVVASGGAGGSTTRDGAISTGGLANTGGRSATGGTASGGVLATGGNASGGALVTGGTASGGALAMGGTSAGGRSTTGGTASGGVTGAGGSAAGGTRLDAASDSPMAIDTADAGKTCGGLAGISCAAGEICDFLAGTCQTSDRTGTCKPKPQGCTTDYQPVCGCDGKTYSNDCSRLVAGVSKQSDGECVTTTVSCPQLITQADCDARGDCHSVFVDLNNCNCVTAGCCARFNHCAVGGRANCDGSQVMCGAATPYCAGPYTVSYTSTCFDGCVLKTLCSGTDAAVAAAPTCPQTAPANGTACGNTSLSCFYDGCPGAGRTQATCVGGSWSVQTAACGAIGCAGYPDTSFTCASGKVCIVSEGGTIGATCVDNGCGTGPVSDQCVAGATGCTMNASTTGGVTFTCNTCPQGGCP